MTNHPLVGRILYDWNRQAPEGRILAVIPTNSAVGDLLLIEKWEDEAKDWKDEAGLEWLLPLGRLANVSEVHQRDSVPVWLLYDARESAAAEAWRGARQRPVLGPEQHPLIRRLFYNRQSGAREGLILAVVPTNGALGDLILIESWRKGEECQRFMPLSALGDESDDSAAPSVWMLFGAYESVEIGAIRGDDALERAERLKDAWEGRHEVDELNLKGG